MLLDFFASLDLNWVIFYSVDLSWSSLSKYTKIFNFSPQLIILFDQISKTPKKFPYFSVDFTLIHHYTLYFVIISLYWWVWNLFWHEFVYIQRTHEIVSSIGHIISIIGVYYYSYLQTTYCDLVAINICVWVILKLT